MRRDRLTTTEGDAGRAANRAARRLPRRPLALAGALLPALAAGIALAAAGAPKLPAPSIGSQPADPTNQTSAHFTYSDAASGASFECSLDGATFAACPAGGVTYNSLSESKHSFKVRATAAGKTSGDATYSWTVDTTPPTAAVAFPVNGSALNSVAWGHGCPQGAGICGTAKDSGGIKAVSISIRQAGGNWWGGSAFNQSTEAFLPTSLKAPGKNSTSWSYALALPADGVYTVHVRASDEAGNTTAAASQATATFTIDTLAPPVPAITSGPEAQTLEKSARFVFSDSESGVSFLCSRDSKKFKVCHSPMTYASNSRASHLFQVEARDAAGNISPAASWKWSVVKTIEGGKPFTVIGNATQPLAPGFSSPIAVTLTNPNSVTITITELNVAVAAASSKPGCEGPANLALTQSSLSAANPLVVPAGGQVTLPSGSVTAPQVLMKDLSTNQDACKNASFTFNYSGSAHS